MRTFFDYDYVECVKLDDAKKEYPHLDWKFIDNRFVWGMGKNEEVDVLTLADLNLCIELYKRNLKLEDINYIEVEHCSVCRKVLLPDDECYSDENAPEHENDALCDEHSIMNEVTDNYRKIIF